MVVICYNDMYFYGNNVILQLLTRVTSPIHVHV